MKGIKIAMSLFLLLGVGACAQKTDRSTIDKEDYQALLSCIQKTDITTIRQGETHRFIDMWMVIVDDRIFARSWQGAKDGWYYKFLKDSNGAIQCGGKFYKIDGVVPADLDEINQRINVAYTEKYGDGEYPDIAKQMISPERMARTLELKVLSKINK